MTKNKKEISWAEKLEEKLLPEEEALDVSFSLIIPTYNCSERIAVTLDSIKAQHYPNLEVIVVDGGSTDRTLEIVASYFPLISRVYTVTDHNTNEMINRGISLTSGDYVATLNPGSSYITSHVFRSFASAIKNNESPDLVYCGSIQRESKRSPRLVHLPLALPTLRRGRHPVTLPACFFKRDLFDTIGKFNPRLSVRSGYDFLCRVLEKENLSKVRLDRVLIDFDYGPFSYTKLMRYASDTWRTLLSHFGFFRALVWFLGVNHLRVFKWWWHAVKQKIF